MCGPRPRAAPCPPSPREKNALSLPALKTQQNRANSQPKLGTDAGSHSIYRRTFILGGINGSLFALNRWKRARLQACKRFKPRIYKAFSVFAPATM